MRRVAALLLLTAVTLSACAPSGKGDGEADSRIRIGFSLDRFQEERWQRDRDIFVAAARNLGAEVIFQAAGGDDYLQLAQAENMLRRGIDVLVVVPHRDTAMAPIVAMAHNVGVKVISYDRLITMADVDLYISFDNEEVGRLQARHMTRLVPKGNYVYIGGAPTDNNVPMLQRGAETVLQPLIERGDIKLVYTGLSDDWLPANARIHMEKALEQTGGKVDAVICGNDGTAGGVIQALYRAQLAGKVPVAGQDADLAAVQRIVRGTQEMTVYKPIRALATKAAEIAVDMANGHAPPTNALVSNGRKAVPAFLLQPIAVHKGNLQETVIKDNFHRSEDVFSQVP